ncbi:MAG: carbonic anhydrase [Hyphomicrobiales bacterium]|nr:MAG: carbonic anhydrase [Hyphomicrobiales bacterium]
MSRTLDHLLDQNVAWADSRTRADPHYFLRMSEVQRPAYLWIGCSDSRVTANDVLGLDPGEVFVHRNIANIVHTSDLNILSVLEYAVEHLKVEHIIVCGHYGCGGVERALVAERSAMLDHWLQPFTMLYRKHRDVIDAIADAGRRLDRMCEINVEMQVRRVAATPIIEKAWMRGQALNLHGWIYAVHDGLLRDLGPHLSSIAERDALPTIDARVLAPAEPPATMKRRQALEAFARVGLESELAACCVCDPSQHGVSP